MIIGAYWGEKMIEIRIHGRGGQGVKKASMILGRAAYLAGYKTQDFALYGAERKGAPVTSFVRFDKEGINTRGYVFEPDYILVIDNTIDTKAIEDGKKKSTKIVVNSMKKLKNGYSVDATDIAMRELNNPLGANVALLGGLIAVAGMISMKHLEEAIRIELKKYSKTIVEGNIRAAKRCYEVIK